MKFLIWLISGCPSKRRLWCQTWSWIPVCLIQTLHTGYRFSYLRHQVFPRWIRSCLFGVIMCAAAAGGLVSRAETHPCVFDEFKRVSIIWRMIALWICTSRCSFSRGRTIKKIKKTAIFLTLVIFPFSILQIKYLICRGNGHTTWLTRCSLISARFLWIINVRDSPRALRGFLSIPLWRELAFYTEEYEELNCPNQARWFKSCPIEVFNRGCRWATWSKR